MTWFSVIKRLTPEERRQTYDFWPKEIRAERTFMNRKINPVLSGFKYWPRRKQQAYYRIKRAHDKQGLPSPTLEEIEEELKNPSSRETSGYTSPSLSPRHHHWHENKWKKKVHMRPNNYNKINNIVMYLRTQNKPINRQSILEEIVSSPTNEDNLAIEYILREMQE